MVEILAGLILFALAIIVVLWLLAGVLWVAGMGLAGLVQGAVVVVGTVQRWRGIVPEHERLAAEWEAFRVAHPEEAAWQEMHRRYEED